MVAKSKIPWLFIDVQVEFEIPWIDSQFPNFFLTLKKISLFFSWVVPDRGYPNNENTFALH